MACCVEELMGEKVIIPIEGKGKVGDFFKKIGKSIKQFFSPDLENFPKSAQKVLKQYGDIPITSLKIVRTPLPQFLQKVLNILTFGKLEQIKKS